VRAVPGAALLRFDGGEADRHRRFASGRHHARPAGAAGVRGGGDQDEHSLPPAPPAVRAVRARPLRHAYGGAAPGGDGPDGRRVTKNATLQNYKSTAPFYRRRLVGNQTRLSLII